MTDTEASVEVNEHTIILRVHFRRQIQPAQYQTAEFATYVEQQIPGTLSPDQIEGHLKFLSQQVKANTFDQLGLYYDQDKESGVIMEVLGGQPVTHTPAQLAPVENINQAAPVVAAAPERPVETSSAPVVPNNPPGGARRKPGGTSRSAGSDIYAQAWADIQANPGNWYCNIADKESGKSNTMAPDFKCKDAKIFANPKKPEDPMALWMTRPDGRLSCPEDFTYANHGWVNGSLPE